MYAYLGQGEVSASLVVQMAAETAAAPAVRRWHWHGLVVRRPGLSAHTAVPRRSLVFGLCLAGLRGVPQSRHDLGVESRGELWDFFPGKGTFAGRPGENSGDRRRSWGLVRVRFGYQKALKILFIF